jgi:hypothetical protein
MNIVIALTGREAASQEIAITPMTLEAIECLEIRTRKK